MKVKILILALVFSIILCSCSGPAPSPLDTTGEDDGIQYPETDVSGVNVTYIKTDGGMVPISVCDNGYSSLAGENYYYNIQSTVDNNLTLPDKTYTTFTNSGINRGSVSFADITDNKLKDASFQTLVTSANWKLVPNLKRTTFDKNVADSGYTQFISDSFPDLADIKVSDIWEYDLDNDGTVDSVVLAKDADYTVLVLLSQTLGNKVLASSFVKDGSFTAYPFIADLDGNGVYTLMTVWGDSLKTVSVYKENSLEEEYRVYLPLDS